jgi:uncharacterized protein (DUF2062 family)
VFRSPHAPAQTARGVAIGVFWGLTPTVGLQTLAIVTTWIVVRKVFRKDSSLVQAMVWVWVNNPLTMVPLYYAFYLTGAWLTGSLSGAEDYGSFGITSVGVPMLIGSAPYAVVGSAVSYRWALWLVNRRRERLARRRLGYETFRTSDPSG